MQQTTHYAALLFRAAGTLIALALLAAVSPSAASAAGSVFIDPGHGGRWPGAVYGGTREADLNLAIALELRSALEQQSYQVRMSRTTDTEAATSDIPTWNSSEATFIYESDGEYTLRDDLQARVNNANAWGADVFVSIHANAATAPTAYGTETYWSDFSVTDRLVSAQLASHIQHEVIAETDMRDRGIKVAGFYVLNWSNMPAVLIETGFMSNASDLEKISSPAFQRRIAYGIARGIDRFYASSPFAPLYPRIQGTDRYATAVEIADAGWPQTGGTAFIVSGESWPDALAGTPFAQTRDAPLLLVRGDSLPPATAERLNRQSPDRIVVLGGGSAVSTSTVDAAVVATGREPSSVAVERLWGLDRAGTAGEIAREIGVPSSGRVFVVSGRSYADALSIAPYAGAARTPILLVEPDWVPAATREFIEEYATLIQRFDVIGGESVIGPDVIDQLAAYGEVVRVAGTDRYQTNSAVISRYWESGLMSPVFATGRTFPDALTASAYAALSSSPTVLLGGPSYVPARTRAFLLHNESRIREVTFVGGQNALSYQSEWMVQKSIGR